MPESRRGVSLEGELVSVLLLLVSVLELGVLEGAVVPDELVLPLLGDVELGDVELGDVAEASVLLRFMSELLRVLRLQAAVPKQSANAVNAVTPANLSFWTFI